MNSHLLSILQILLLALQGIISIVFVVIVMSQPSKNEGLSGNITAQTSPNFKGKPGFEDRMQELTKRLGVAWFVVSIAVAIAYSSH